MILQYHWFWWLLSSAAAFACGEICSKLWANNSKWYYIPLAVLCYVACSVLWLPAIKEYNKLAVVGIVWSVLAVLTTAIIGIVVFREKLEWYQWLGLVLATVAIILLGGE